MYIAKTSKNSISHGFYSSEIVLPWENQQEFDDLLKAFREECCPDAVSEEAAVFELASLHWKKRRYETRSHHALQEQGDPTAGAGSNTWKSLADHARAGAASKADAAVLVYKNITKLLERIMSDEANSSSEVIELERWKTLAKELHIVGTGWILPMLGMVEKLEQDERAKPPGIMERDLKFQAEIDRRIEKALKRLVMIKEYKKYYVAKAVDAKSVEIEVLPAKPTDVSGSTDPGS